MNPDRYLDVAAFVDDVRLLFNNVRLYYRVSIQGNFALLETRFMTIHFWFAFNKQEDSKIYKSAKYLERFFEELLLKYLPDYAAKRSNTNGNAHAPELKRIRTENQRPLEIIDDGDDDVILA